MKRQRLRDPFRRYVRGVEVPPYDEALAFVGLKLNREPARTHYDAGISLERGDQSSMIIEVIRPGSAAENAGLQVGDTMFPSAVRMLPARTGLGC